MTEDTAVDTGTAGMSGLLTALARAGVRLRLVGEDKLEVQAPRGRLTPPLRDGLTRHKRELIAHLAGRSEPAPETEEDLPSITPDPDRLYEPFPPTDLQQSFMIGSREGFEYYVRPHQYMEFDFDELDPVRFERALNAALRRQRRSIVVVRDDMRLQTVRDPEPVRIEVTDLRQRRDDEVAAHLERVRAAMEREEPPHDRWPWLRSRITLYGAGRGRLHYNNNNLFTDAPSGTSLINDALHYYHHPDQPLPEIELSFRDCALALARLEDSSLGEASRRYWCDRMNGWPDAPAIPLVPGQGRSGRSQLHRREFLLAPELWSRIKRAADRLGLTLTSTLLGAHVEVLAYWSGSRHFLLNNMITHRLPLHPQSGEVLGQFASLYPLEVDWRHEEGFADRVRRLQGQVVSDVSHAYWSGAKVLQELNHVRRTPGRALCPFAVGSALFVGPTQRPFHSMLETPQTLLDTEFWDLRDGRLWVIWDVIETMFPEGLIDVMFEGYQAVLAALAEHESAWRRPAFALLPQAQRERRATLNSTPAHAGPGLLTDLLAANAERCPDAAAVVDARGELSYAELYADSVRLAGRLGAAGVGRGDLVAVVLPKGREQISAVHAALTAGAAYVPVDPAWPDDRVRFVLGDTEAVAVVTNSASEERIAGLCGAAVLPVDGDRAAGNAEPGTAAGAGGPVEPGDMAYVIYTSGSTGRPKGAMLNHSGPLNTVSDINHRFGIGAGDVVLGVSSLCFDLSVYDVFGACEAGATLVLPTAEQTDPASWVDLVREQGVTVWNSVPALMELFTEAADAAGVELPSLRTVLLSGDWIPVDLPERIRRIAPHARVISLGGATEASIWSICFPIDEQDPEGQSIPYGKPLAGQSWHVLDATGRDAPDWVTGELYIGGAGVALGYLGDTERTEASFVTHPVTGEPLYRTGDLGRYLPDGNIEFLGRADFQVKVQGFRVELGEIEHALRELPGIRQAAVVTRDSGAGKQLAACVVGDGDGGGRPDPGELAAALAMRLPRYMVPEQINVLKELPLTPNGKLDRQALERIGGREPGDERPLTPPRGPVESALAEIWTEVLGCDRLGVHDDFFDIGGQSFAALRVLGKVAERFGRRVPLGVLLERPTVAGLAEHLTREEGAWSPLVRLTGSGDGSSAPYFLVHPAGGNVLCYRELAELLDRPCAAFQAPGAAGGGEPRQTAGELAELYVRALREVQPAGPYRLGGWSSGGVLAFEMARLLESTGARVERLVILDCPAPLVPREMDEEQLLLWFLEDLNIGFDPHSAEVSAVRKLTGPTQEERLDALYQLAAGQGVEAALPDRASLGATMAVFQGTVRGCNSYRAAPIRAGLTVLRAAEGCVGEFSGHPYAESPDWGWSLLTGGSVDTGTLPCTHHTLLTDPRALSAVAASLNE